MNIRPVLCVRGARSLF